MTICRKCGKEIPDGEELCEECKMKESDSGESYLDELMVGMDEVRNPLMDKLVKSKSEKDELPEDESTDGEEPDLALEPEFAEAEESIEEPEEELALEPEFAETEESVEEPEPEEEPELALEPESAEEEEPEEEPEMEMVLEAESEEEPEPEEEPELALEPEFAEEEKPEEEEPEEEESEEEEPDIDEELEGDLESEEDINELLKLLSKDYEEEGFDVDSKDEESSEEEGEAPSTLSAAPEKAEASLFSENESGDIFADGSDSIAVDDVFQDALSAVDYSEKENNEDDEPVALDPFVMGEEGISDAGEGADPISVIPVPNPEEPIAKKKAKKKDSFWKRIFGNIITDETAEEEAKEREQEKADEEARAQAKEEKKQQAEVTKQEKEEQAKAEKERKAAEKAERATAKQAEKEEKKRLKMEQEANEVVGRVNPVGATVVMVFFGLICIAVILGTRTLSYSSAVKNAESNFEEGDYKGAYESIAGVEVSESYAEMADKVRICMQLQRELDSYSNYYKMKMYLEALDSLMKGVRSYDTNRDKADDYEILAQYDALKEQVTSNLYREFGVSETQARSINNTEGQVEYTAKLEEIIRLWEARNREDER